MEQSPSSHSIRNLEVDIKLKLFVEQRVALGQPAPERGAKFSDTISHDWMMLFVEHRIGDRRVLGLIRKQG